MSLWGDLLTSSVVLLFMDECFTYEEISVHSAGEGDAWLEGVFGVMFDIMFVPVLTCSISQPLFFTHARLAPTRRRQKGISGAHAGLRQSGP